MAKINSGNLPKIQQTLGSEAQRASNTEAAQQTQKAKAKGPIDQVDAKAQGGVPEASSPLTDTLWEGLAGLAESYYGDASPGPKGGLDLLLKTASGNTDIDAQVSPEMRAMKAQRLSRETGIPAETSKQIVDLVARLLAV